MIATGVGKGKFAPVLGGGKVCGGLVSSQPPIAGGLQYSVNEDAVLTDELSVVDDNQDSIEFELVTSTTSGSLTLETDGSFIYVPNADFIGKDEFKFTAYDGFERSNTGTATIFVANVNDAPVAYAANINASNNTKASGAVTATDIDDTISTLDFRIVTGSVPVSDVALMQGDGTFDYTPNGFCVGGSTRTFSVIASDLKDDSAAIVVTVTATDC